MDDLTGNPVALSDLCHLEPILENFHDCLVALFHDAQLHEHCPDLPWLASLGPAKAQAGRRCRQSAEAV